MPKQVGVDFDGIFNLYKGWKGEDDLSDPRPGIHTFLMNLRNAGFVPIVYSTRSSEKILAWLKVHGLDGLVDGVTNIKPPAFVTLDDRVVCFHGDFDRAFEEIVNFKPFWQT